MQKSVAHPNSSVQRNADTESQSELERSTEVLLRVAMLAQQSQPSAQIAREPPILTSESKNRDDRNDERGLIRSLKNSGACQQPRTHSPA